jgi:O-antigen/teichoic acid export membrane protein
VRGDRADLQRLLGQISTTNLLLSTPILLVLLLFPDPLLALFGEEFAAPEVRGLLAVLGVAQWINANCGPVLNLMNMTGLQRAANRVILATAVLNLLLNLWWIPRWGLQGAAWATAVSTVVWNGVSVVWIRKNLGVWTILGWAGRGR